MVFVRLACHRHHQTAKTYAVDALKVVLIRYIVFCGTTAGVERINAVITRVLQFRGDAANSTDVMLLKLISDKGNYDEDHVIGLAQELWVRSYGHIRKRERSDNVQRGIKRRVQDMCVQKGERGKLTQLGF